MTTEIIDIKNLFEELIKEYETSETQAILFYSSERPRDFRLMEAKVNRFRERLNAVISNGVKSEQVSET